MNMKNLGVIPLVIAVLCSVVWFVRKQQESRVVEQVAKQTDARLCDVLMLQSQTSEMLLDQVSVGYRARDHALKQWSDWQAGRVPKEDNQLGYYSGSFERATRHEYMIEAVCQSANAVHVNMRRVSDMMTGSKLPEHIETIDCSGNAMDWPSRRMQVLDQERLLINECKKRFGTQPSFVPAPLVLFIE